DSGWLYVVNTRTLGCGWSEQLVWGYSLFFFSSRRRHTRFKCDWSSDVCSSDLLKDVMRLFNESQAAIERRLAAWQAGGAGYQQRSEERRVGKECRYRWSA